MSCLDLWILDSFEDIVAVDERENQVSQAIARSDVERVPTLYSICGAFES